MRAFDIIGFLTTLTALFAYVNHRFLRLPATIGLMAQSLVLSLVLLVGMSLGVELREPVRQLFTAIDFNTILLEGLLSFLLFAGALFVKNEEIFEVKTDIAVFAVAGVVLSAGLIAGFLYLLSSLVGLHLSFLSCCLFGTLISPTDPVAVLPTLRSLGIPGRLSAQIAGEAMFNDGVGIVAFLSLLSLTGGEGVEAADVALLFLRQAAGGIVYGAALGWIGYRLMKTVDNYQLEILITLAMVTGGYSLARVLGISGPLAMVLAGLFIGGRGRKLAMSEKTRENLDRFWELVEEMLNSLLFTLIGLELLVITPVLTGAHVIVGIAAIPLVLLARYLSIASLRSMLRGRNKFRSRSVRIMTWSGLRGGIAIALSLSLPDMPDRSVVLFATYVVVAFSILVQGLTMKYLAPVR